MSRSVCPAESIEHEFPLVVELQAEPVPSDEILVEIGGPELMVHPTCAGHVERFVPDREFAGCGQSGEGIVMGGLSHGQPLRLIPSAPCTTSGFPDETVSWMAMSPSAAWRV